MAVQVVYWWAPLGQIGLVIDGAKPNLNKNYYQVSIKRSKLVQNQS